MNQFLIFALAIFLGVAYVTAYPQNNGADRGRGNEDNNLHDPGYLTTETTQNGNNAEKDRNENGRRTSSQMDFVNEAAENENARANVGKDNQSGIQRNQTHFVKRAAQNENSNRGQEGGHGRGSNNGQDQTHFENGRAQNRNDNGHANVNGNGHDDGHHGNLGQRQIGKRSAQNDNAKTGSNSNQHNNHGRSNDHGNGHGSDGGVNSGNGH